jgi:uncharacterized paraquat-inducible protein A
MVTYTCDECGTIVAANVLEDNRCMKCPRNGCHNVLEFDDLPSEKRQYFLDNVEKYDI